MPPVPTSLGKGLSLLPTCGLSFGMAGRGAHCLGHPFLSCLWLGCWHLEGLATHRAGKRGGGALGVHAASALSSPSPLGTIKAGSLQRGDVLARGAFLRGQLGGGESSPPSQRGKGGRMGLQLEGSPSQEGQASLSSPSPPSQLSISFLGAQSPCCRPRSSQGRPGPVGILLGGGSPPDLLDPPVWGRGRKHACLEARSFGWKSV